MSDFIPTVTITLAEYEQLKRDASPVRIWRDELRWAVGNALSDTKPFMLSSDQRDTNRARFERWAAYAFRCALKGEQPTPMDEWEPKP